jgi:glutamate receptor, ionotropic, plant
LLKNEDVHGILGPQTSAEDTFAEELGRKAQVPLISFTSRSKSLSYAKNPYFIRTTPDNSNQVKALATICQGFEWHEVVILYEDTDYGNQFTSELNREFLMADIRVAYMIAISASAADYQIKKKLENLMRIQTRVFIVHMNAVLGGRLFVLAKGEKMMSEGYAWLVTDSLGNFLNSIDSTTFDSMEGILGIRPHVPKSEKLESFQERWKRNMILTKSESAKAELNVYGLWAYDTVWALAMAVEKIRPVNTSFLKLNSGANGSDISNLRLSQFGPKLLDEFYNTSFVGLGGAFQLIDGQLKPSALEIFNIIETGGRTMGGGRLIGYWTPDGGITRTLASIDDMTYSTSTKELKSIVWPGDSAKKPVGWSIPTPGKLRVGIPSKSGFTEFVNVSIDPVTKKINASGFCIDIFLSSLQLLPLKVDPEFFTFDPKGTTYSELIYSLANKVGFSLFLFLLVYDCISAFIPNACLTKYKKNKELINPLFLYLSFGDEADL